ncbi:MAG: hypothetical protein IKC83_01060, partial [Clostridia bacterium]|nr:hypothetical protein [Clostridia bacterium]
AGLLRSGVRGVADGDFAHVCPAFGAGEPGGGQRGIGQIGVLAPYKFSMKDALKNGENHLEIEVTGNLGHYRRDMLSSFIQIPPTGIVDKIFVCLYK